MWLRIDDRFHGHVKVRRAGNAAVGLWVRCATYSAQYGTDGVIPADIATDYGRGREIAALNDAGLWVPDPDAGTFVIRDFLEYNPSAASVRAAQLERDDARRRGGLARAAGARRDDHGQFVTTNGEHP